MTNTLTITNLIASVDEKQILHGVNLTVHGGQIHAIMGPNGSGKSTLAYALMGHPGYEIYKSANLQIDKSKASNKKNTYSSMMLDGEELLALPTEERAKRGLFLALQSPIAIPGVSVINLMRTAYQEIHGKQSGEVPSSSAIQNPVLARRWRATDITMGQFMTKVKEYARILSIDDAFLHRGIHDGFSGGEKKKMEMLQALILKPKFAIFDEIDTGLDVDALKIVAAGVKKLVDIGTGVIIITHYQRILKHIAPDFVHIFVKGKIVKTADAQLAQEIEVHGYDSYL